MTTSANSPSSFVAYVVSQNLVKYSSRLPSNIGRSVLVHSLVNSLGLFSSASAERRLQVVNPRRASYRDLAVYHSREYLDFVLNPKHPGTPADYGDDDLREAREAFGLEDDCPIFEGMSDYIQLVAGATMTAANALKLGKVETAICWDGGRHHAQKSRASGFCYVADCVLAILLLKRSLPLSNSSSVAASVISPSSTSAVSMDTVPIPPSQTVSDSASQPLDTTTPIITPQPQFPSTAGDMGPAALPVDDAEEEDIPHTHSDMELSDLTSNPVENANTNIPPITSGSEPTEDVNGNIVVDGLGSGLGNGSTTANGSQTTTPVGAPRKPRIMYLDLDIHFGDGVAQAFYSPHSSGTSNSNSNRQVLTLSIHHTSPGFFPESPLLSSLPPLRSASDTSFSTSEPEQLHSSATTRFESPVPTLSSASHTLPTSSTISSPAYPTSTTSSFPSSFDPYTLSIPLLPGASCKTYASIWPIVERIRAGFDPDCIVVQCGVDGLSGDPKVRLGNWSLGGSSKTIFQEDDEAEDEDAVKAEKHRHELELELELEEGSLGWCISRIVNHWPGKKLFLGGGGYNHPNAARAWAFLTSVITGSPLPLSTPIPQCHANKPSETFQYFPSFAPSFTLDVPPGNMYDLNTGEYFDRVKRAFEGVYEVLEGGQASG
ncbi:hypothetical protein D9758_011417 [Tetrapyrgos nigripes]|uniref:histone deacetylase n=1 Tax=Tetrapyrgos nigripes TaxID=182062 RepID=A0A8H5CQ13_9AGAR|nr:hypothetical protein D9758_011417 [Tetrapyrgos nigripes]